MRLINRIGALAQQNFILTGNQGQRINMSLRYAPTQEAWFVDFTLDDFTVRGVRVVSTLNLLRQYRNNIPFGIRVLTNNNLDPYYIDDFSSNRAQMYLLTAEEVAQVESVVFS